MFSLKIQNAKNEIFELTHDSKNYSVISVQGLAPPQTVVNTSTGGLIDGAFFNSARLQQRNIVITIVINGDIETNRQRLYKIFNLKKLCKIFFQNEKRNVQIEGYVETAECDLFTQREQMQISIICPRPYFEDLNVIYTELAQITREFEFPFAISEPIPFSESVENPVCTITNYGDVECGVIITATITGSVMGLKIYNTTTQKYIGFDTSFSSGDIITINTLSGQLGATLLRAGATTNLLNLLSAGSEWLKLDLGDNNFTFSTISGSENIQIEIVSTALYGGV